MGTGLGTGTVLQRKMPKKQEDTSLIWFTTNLRTRDNQALSEAIKSSSLCSAVFCIDSRWFVPSDLGFPKMGPFRAKFLLESLEDLAFQLSELGIPFDILIGKPEETIPQYIQSHKITQVFLQKEWTSEELDAFQKIRTKCPTTISWNTYYDQFLIHPEDLSFDLQELPFMFTEFRKKVEKSWTIRPETHPKFKATQKETIKTKVPTLESLGLKTMEHQSQSAFPFNGGSRSASKRLQHYFWETDGLQSYKETRNNLIGPDYSSKLSPWLANGSISARTLYHELKRYEAERGANQSTYWLVFELLWRDFFKYVALKFGNRIFHAQGIRSKKKMWKNDFEDFKKWRDGKTPSPFVNANMIELNSTGWMSNRGRQNVASYLTKTLEIDWRWGARYFESLLLDYDVHSNYGNWMYVAGVGNDPRDRLFNVDKQSQQYDPDGAYQKIWLPQNPQV